MKILKADTIRFNLQPLLPKTEGKVAYVLAYNNYKLMNELAVYDETRANLIEKYKVNDGGDMEGFIKEISPIADTEIKIEFIKIPVDELRNTNLSGDVISFLMNNGMVEFEV